jgi:hypothetical protein
MTYPMRVRVTLFNIAYIMYDLHLGSAFKLNRKNIENRILLRKMCSE